MIRLVLFTVVAAHHRALSASVSETFATYSCEEGLQVLKSERASTATDCEQNWTMEESLIGTFVNGSVECHRPCSQVAPGEIIISSCANVTLTVLCSQGYLTEYRIHYLGTGINPLPLQNFKKRAHYGIYACSALLLLVFVGLLIQHYISQSHGIRHTALNHP